MKMEGVALLYKDAIMELVCFVLALHFTCTADMSLTDQAAEHETAADDSIAKIRINLIRFSTFLAAMNWVRGWPEVGNT
jgi:hypothetical protein